MLALVHQIIDKNWDYPFKKKHSAFATSSISKKIQAEIRSDNNLTKSLKLAKNYAKQGVETNFVVYKLDRLTRKMLHLSSIIEDLTKHGIHLQSIHENIETDSLTGKFFCLMLGYVAEWELQAISERTKDGLRKAKEKGVKLGNKGLSKVTEKQIIEQYLRNELPVRKIANQLNISTATIYNVLKRNGIQINRKNHL